MTKICCVPHRVETGLATEEGPSGLPDYLGKDAMLANRNF